MRRFRHLRRLLAAALFVVLIPLGLMALKVFTIPHAMMWLPSQISDVVDDRAAMAERTEHLLVVVADHWEPGRGEAAERLAESWLTRFAEIAADHRDGRGRTFRYSWFYPIDHRNRAIMSSLAQAVGRGLGEVEVHWHHHHDDAAVFERDLVDGLDDFRAEGLLPERDGRPAWAFIHGNWALDNSIEHQCGISNEVEILQRHGCYMDMTFPAIFMSSNPHQANRLLRMNETPAARSYDDARVARVRGDDGGFLIFQGPLGLDPTNVPVFVEYSALDNAVGTGMSGVLARPSEPRDYFRPSRVRFWHRAGIGVEGRPEWTFAKLHVHGIQTADLVLGGLLDAALDELERYTAEKGITLHYVTAREAYNVVRAAERGMKGNPAVYYDLEVPPPPAAGGGPASTASE